jgi:uncharacterized membrane protein
VTQRAALWLAIVLTAISVGGQPANAGFRVCNQTDKRINVAFGFVDREHGWTAQGWWVMDGGECKVVHRADLDNRYYYLFARGGRNAWAGDVPFCIEKKKFRLFQAQYGKNTPDDCAKAGLEFAQFFKVDVSGAKDYTQTIAINTAGAPTSIAGAPPNAPSANGNPEQPYRPPVATAAPQPYQPPAQQPSQPAPQQTYQPPPQQPYQAPAQPPYQPPAQQTYQPPVQRPNQPPMQQPYQPPAQQTYQPPVPQPYQPPMQQPNQPPAVAQPQPAPQPGGAGGSACQRYPNLC